MPRLRGAHREQTTRTTSGVYRHVVVPVIDAAVASTDALYPDVV